jgi:hypothetical protein
VPHPRTNECSTAQNLSRHDANLEFGRQSGSAVIRATIAPVPVPIAVTEPGGAILSTHRGTSAMTGAPSLGAMVLPVSLD